MTDLSQMTKEQQEEAMWQEHEQDALIKAYVPDAGNYSHRDAAALAVKRDQEAAKELEMSVLNLEGAVNAIRKPKMTAAQAMRELGF